MGYEEISSRIQQNIFFHFIDFCYTPLSFSNLIMVFHKRKMKKFQNRFSVKLSVQPIQEEEELNTIDTEYTKTIKRVHKRDKLKPGDTSNPLPEETINDSLFLYLELKMNYDEERVCNLLTALQSLILVGKCTMQDCFDLMVLAIHFKRPALHDCCITGIKQNLNERNMVKVIKVAQSLQSETLKLAIVNHVWDQRSNLKDNKQLCNILRKYQWIVHQLKARNRSMDIFRENGCKLLMAQ